MKNEMDRLLYEECILCYKLTTVKKEMPVDYRKYYIYGVGQMCEECAEKLKESDNDRNTMRVVE